jgi:hypothetical protein
MGSTVGSVDARELPGTQNANYPFWSPDEKSIGFFADGKLKQIEVAGGGVQTLCEASNGGGSWNSNGVILFTARGGLQRIASRGGAPAIVTSLEASRQERAHRLPQFLPDGRPYLYLVQGSDPNSAGIYAGSLDRPEERLRILGTNSKAIYAALSGHSGCLLWLRNEDLVCQVNRQREHSRNLW